MAKRRKVALIYEYNENWIGGTYYIQNLIAALNVIPDAQKPELIIITNEEKHFIDLSNVTRYPYIYYRGFERKLTLAERAINKISNRLINSKPFSSYHKDIEIVFPAAHEQYFSKVKNHLYWIPDFQEHYLPHFFTKEEIDGRKEYQLSIIKKAKYIVFSSKAAKNDFNKIYPQNNVKQFLLPFAVTHSSAKNNQNSDINLKYKLPDKYFICSNQFWKHKNHHIVLRAICYLKHKGIEVFVAFTGKEHDYRNPLYFEELCALASNLDVNDNIKFLGFIDRVDQLALLKNSLSVIQPSLFEGWSTVIEDAKAINIPIIASSIDVHKEQLDLYKKKQFFSPDNEKELADCLINAEERIDFYKYIEVYDYDAVINTFANSFIRIIKGLN